MCRREGQEAGMWRGTKRAENDGSFSWGEAKRAAGQVFTEGETVRKGGGGREGLARQQVLSSLGAKKHLRKPRE